MLLRNLDRIMADAFISYSRKDKDFVRRLDAALKTRKREAWIDWEGIRPTEEFMQAIYRAIEAADTFIFVLTPDSVASVVCGREVAHATAHNKRLVPLVQCDVDAAKVPEGLAKLNWIFCRDSDDFEKAVDTVITALDTDLEWVHAHTRLLTRAIEWESKGKNNSFVLRGVDLRAAEQWLAQAGTDKERQPTALQTEYIIASRKAAAMRQRITLGAVSLALVIAVILAVVALFARQEAVKQRDIAVTQQKMSASRELAATSEMQLQIDPELSVLLGIEAARRWPTSEAQLALRHAILGSHLLRMLGSQDDGVSGAFFSPDGKFLLTIGKDARLWNPATAQEIAEIQEEKGFRSVVFSPDGKSFVLLSSSGTVRFCDASSGRTIKAIRDGSALSMSAAFASDGVVVASAVGSAGRVWQMNSGKTLCELRGHKGEISSAVLSPNAAWVLTQSKDDTARLWETATGRNVSTWNSPVREGWGGTFSPDGTLLVHGAADYTAVIRNVATGQIVHELHGHNGGIKHYEFSRDNKFVVTACFDGAARVFEVATGRLVVELRAFRGLVDHASFSPDGNFVVTSDFDNAARIWQLATGDTVAVLRAPDTFRSAIFSPDGVSVVSVGGKGIRIWRVPHRLELRGHTDILWRLAWSPDGTSLVTAARDTVPRVWDVATGKQLSELHGHTKAVWEAVFSPDGKRILTASVDHTARVWDAFSGECLHVLAGHTDDVGSAIFSPDGLLAVTTSRDKTARVWNATSGACVHELRGHSADVWCAAFSPDGKLIVTASSDSTARLWDTATGKPVAELKGHEKGIHGVAFSPNGKLLVTASEDHTARVWDVGLAKATAVLRGHNDGVFAAVFSPDSRLVLTASHYSSPLIFDAERGEELIALRGHSGELTSATFSQDGKFVLTSAGDQKTIVWDPATGNQVMQLRGFRRGVETAAFSPNGRMIVTAGWDPADRPPIYSSAQIVDAEVCCPLDELLVLASRRVTRSLTGAERVVYLHEPAGQSENNEPKQSP